MRRRPETNQWRVRVDRQIGTRLVVEQVDTLDLAVLQNERVDIERMGIEREKAILPDRHGANLIAHTTLFRQNPIGQVRTVKKEIAVDRFRMGVIRIIERGMGSYLKMERRRPRIRDLPDDLDLSPDKPVTDLQTEISGKKRARRLIAFQNKTQLVRALRDQREIAIAGETVLRQLMDLPIHPVSRVPEASDDREQHRRMAFPESGVRLPQVLSPRRVVDNA